MKQQEDLFHAKKKNNNNKKKIYISILKTGITVKYMNISLHRKIVQSSKIFAIKKYITILDYHKQFYKKQQINKY